MYSKLDTNRGVESEGHNPYFTYGDYKCIIVKWTGRKDSSNRTGTVVVLLETAVGIVRSRTQPRNLFGLCLSKRS
jgi:hypothetical protein